MKKRIKTRAYLRRRLAVFLVLAGILVIVSLIAPLMCPNDPNATSAAAMNQAPSAQFPFGTDRYGRCVCSRVLMGARTSIFSGVALVGITFIFGTALGLLAGWYGGVVDTLIMPCLALSIPMCGRFIRQFRAELLEQLGQPYVSGAMLRGVKQRYILKNVVHNAAIPILTIVGLSIGTLMGGSVVIETIFRWPGLGKLAMDAITNRDYPVIQGFVLFTSTVYVIINLLIDICYSWVDPRLRKNGGRS